jgi:hypothetical protein
MHYLLTENQCETDIILDGPTSDMYKLYKEYRHFVCKENNIPLTDSIFQEELEPYFRKILRKKKLPYDYVVICFIKWLRENRGFKKIKYKVFNM